MIDGDTDIRKKQQGIRSRIIGKGLEQKKLEQNRIEQKKEREDNERGKEKII